MVSLVNFSGYWSILRVPGPRLPADIRTRSKTLAFFFRMRPFSVVRIWYPWIPLHDLSFGLFLIARSLLVLVLPFPRHSSTSPPPLSLVLSLLETALARQILSPLLFFLLMPILLLPFFRLCHSSPLLFRLNILSIPSFVFFLSC